VQLWGVDTGKVLRRYEGHTHAINAVAFSSDGKYIASGGLDESIRLWPARK
jgi:WD40 repeat protein